MITDMTKPLHAPTIVSDGGAAGSTGSSRAPEVDDDVATKGDALSDVALGELRRKILRRVTPILRSVGVVDGQTVCRLDPQPTQLGVEFDLPVTVSQTVRHALAVRVLDAVRGAGRTYGPVHVSVRDP